MSINQYELIGLLYIWMVITMQYILIASWVEYIPKEIKTFIVNKNVITNIYRLQAYNSIISGYFCIGFIGFMLKGKILLDHTILFFRNNYETNDKIIFSVTKKMKKLYCIICGKYRKFG